LNRDRGVKILLGMCASEIEEMRHRGVVCLKNLVTAPGDTGFKGREALRKERGAEILRDMLVQTASREVMETGVEVMRALV